MKQLIRYRRNAGDPEVANSRLSTGPEISIPLSRYDSVASALSHRPKNLLGSQLALTIAPCSPMKRGSSGCVRAMVRS